MFACMEERVAVHSTDVLLSEVIYGGDLVHDIQNGMQYPINIEEMHTAIYFTMRRIAIRTYLDSVRMRLHAKLLRTNI